MSRMPARPPAASPPRPTTKPRESERPAKPPAIPIASPVIPPRMVKTRVAFLRSARVQRCGCGLGKSCERDPDLKQLRRKKRVHQFAGEPGDEACRDSSRQPNGPNLARSNGVNPAE